MKNYIKPEAEVYTVGIVYPRCGSVGLYDKRYQRSVLQLDGNIKLGVVV